MSEYEEEVTLEEVVTGAGFIAVVKRSDSPGETREFPVVENGVSYEPFRTSTERLHFLEVLHDPEGHGIVGGDVDVASGDFVERFGGHCEFETRGIEEEPCIGTYRGSLEEGALPERFVAFLCVENVDGRGIVHYAANGARESVERIPEIRSILDAAGR